jgi:hypothetical protein
MVILLAKVYRLMYETFFCITRVYPEAVTWPVDLHIHIPVPYALSLNELSCVEQISAVLCISAISYAACTSTLLLSLLTNDGGNKTVDAFAAKSSYPTTRKLRNMVVERASTVTE